MAKFNYSSFRHINNIKEPCFPKKDDLPKGPNTQNRRMPCKVYSAEEREAFVKQNPHILKKDSDEKIRSKKLQAKANSQRYWMNIRKNMGS